MPTFMVVLRNFIVFVHSLSNPSPATWLRCHARPRDYFSFSFLFFFGGGGGGLLVSSSILSFLSLVESGHSLSARGRRGCPINPILKKKKREVGLFISHSRSNLTSTDRYKIRQIMFFFFQKKKKKNSNMSLPLTPMLHPCC